MASIKTNDTRNVLVVEGDVEVLLLGERRDKIVLNGELLSHGLFAVYLRLPGRRLEVAGMAGINRRSGMRKLRNITLQYCCNRDRVPRRAFPLARKR